ncbi:hypothetical protein [Enterococcus sp. N249-2]
MNRNLVLEYSESPNKFSFNSTIEEARQEALKEFDQIRENLDTLQKLTVDCDKVDYALAISSGAICGILDIFLIGQPNDSKLLNITDIWVENRMKDFAKLCGWSGSNGNSASAIRFLESKFKVNYDQRGAGDDLGFLTPSNHHMKSLGHNPSLLGLFYSVLDQFTNQSHFVSDGEVMIYKEDSQHCALLGRSSVSKLFCAIANWVGHLISDISGSSGSKGRGMGIPSPLWSWTNDVIVLKATLKIPRTQFDLMMNELALQIFTEGYDMRYQTMQNIPVLVNEMVVRLFYAIRRTLKYVSETPEEQFSYRAMLKVSVPISQVSINRMLTVAHGTFCLLDIGEAAVSGFINGGGYFNALSCGMRLNLAGIGRFGVAVYQEAWCGIEMMKQQDIQTELLNKKAVLQNYMTGLSLLSERYDDQQLIKFVSDFEHSDVYKEVFEASVTLAQKRNVPDAMILHSKQEGDQYFMGGNR